MKVRILLFAAAKDLARNSSVDVDVSADSTIGELRTVLAESYPTLRSLMQMSRFAIDHQFVADDTRVSSGSEIAMIPPVSGG
jgi:molybdopterin converting factor subunit 1